MTRVEAPSRLHFGLLSLSSEDRWTNREGDALIPARRFGGVGLMVQAPGVCVSVEAAAEWHATGPMAERARNAALKVAPPGLPPRHIHVDRCAPEHVGLGTGTQLELAVAHAVADACRLPPRPAGELALLLGRGLRSALGIRGFAQGGFLVESGKGGDLSALAPLAARVDFPAQWRIVLTVPGWSQGMHGKRERQAFQHLLDQGSTTDATSALCRLTLLGMLPALVERDLAAFGEALYDFNARVGEAFASVQGGVYAHARLADVVAFVRQQGVTGVGQSSWGATIFAVVADDDRANDLAVRIRKRFLLSDSEVICTAANNTGATLTRD
ncbi:MAG: hypothetical protein K2R98_33585 [Gemmataceae bacterium]|nr:hypothetical protein [Gemmataceae bacterium]